MSSLFWLSYVLLWVVVVLCVALLVLLYRQYGLSLLTSRERFAMAGVEIGAAAPELAMHVGGRELAPAGWSAPGGGRRVWIALFASPQCGVCEELADDEAMAALPGEWPDVGFLWVDAGDTGCAGVCAPGSGWTCGVSPDERAHNAMRIPATPYAYAVSASGRVLTKSIVNDADDVRDLVQAALRHGDGQPARATARVG